MPEKTVLHALASLLGNFSSFLGLLVWFGLVWCMHLGLIFLDQTWLCAGSCVLELDLSFVRLQYGGLLFAYFLSIL